MRTGRFFAALAAAAMMFSALSMAALAQEPAPAQPAAQQTETNALGLTLGSDHTILNGLTTQTIPFSVAVPGCTVSVQSSDARVQASIDPAQVYLTTLANEKFTATVTVAAQLEGYPVARQQIQVTAVNKPARTNENVTGFPEEVLRLVNIERKTAGLNPVVLDETLCQLAQIRAEEVGVTWSHNRPDGTLWATVLYDNNYSFQTAGENCASGQTTPAQVMDSWMNSPSHKENILHEEFTKMGIGIYPTREYGLCWEQIFAS